MVLLGLGEEKDSFQILESDNTNTGIEYYYPKKGLEHLKIKDRLLVKKYVALLNRIQMIDVNDRFFFVDEQATAIQLLIDIYNKPVFSSYKTHTINLIKEEIKTLSEKFDRYKESGISEFEKKKTDMERKKANKDFYMFKDSDDIHYEFIKTLTNIYTLNLKKKD